MNKRYLLLAGLLLVAALFVSACSAQTSASAGNDHEAEAAHEEESGHDEDGGHEDDGHMDGMTHIHAEAPAEFEALVNPVAGDAAAIAAGQEIFVSTCAVCHGQEGRGDGENAVNLDPNPANLADGMMLSTLSDGYLFWRVSKGGAIEPFNSAMPAWESSLTEDQRWQVVTFIRSLPDTEHGMEEDHSAGEEMHMEGEHSD
jgi:mono/diheme cytochrome c family protein